MINWDKYNDVGGQTDITWPEKGKDLEIGQEIEGRYIGKQEDIGPNKSKIYVLEVGNKKVGVWGSTVLDTKFAGVAFGKMVAIQYIGDKKGKGTKPYKDFRFGVGIDVAGDENVS